MRLFRVVPVLSLLFAGARASSLHSRQPASHRLDVRDLLDTCATVSTDLAVHDLLGILTAVGAIGGSPLCFLFHPLYIMKVHVPLYVPDRLID